MGCNQTKRLAAMDLCASCVKHSKALLGKQCKTIEEVSLELMTFQSGAWGIPIRQRRARGCQL